MGLLLQSIAFSLILFIIISILKLSEAIDCGGMNIASNITVDQHDKGAFQTIQAAIDSIKSFNDQWVKIHINAGTYMEKVGIPEDKPCVFLEGDDMSNTIVTYGDHEQTDSSATFTSIPSNVIVSGVTFKNSYNLGPYSKLSNVTNGTFDDIKPAAAARIYGDKTYLYKCGFWGFQDTLFDQLGRHYFKDCYIQGEVDFIFGYAQSIYENCWINATQGESNSPGYVTAHGRQTSTDPGGFVFLKGYLIGNGKVNLGRAWGPYSRVIFHRMYMSQVVTPQGWDAWDYIGHE
ncbi:hypothetical protein TanjilG_19088 [Lupinus angustifolius]|uniref:pectinesterase n=1 Tax=Lupinus angustifolius TaxID=3871 RepID=A0A4P1RRT6_LUPAN|nr:PREDICTED: putative pectinesterase 10 [Lupinus angustifolius]OIW16372.1 hypothetical protein TanjilG_19088 [Lupinus angustifolius]